MNFGFYDQYKQYSTVELLKIVKKATDYQPEAVEAARAVLAQRQVAQHELEEADHFIKEEEKQAKAFSNKIGSYKEKAADFFEPIINPGTEVKPVKWLNILLLFTGLQYVWIFYDTIKDLLHSLQCRYCGFDFSMFLLLVNLIYIPLILYLLYKKRKWGWILLFADNLFILIIRLGETYTFFKYREFHRGSTSEFLFLILVRAAFVFFLWRKTIADFFGVTGKIKKDTAMIAGALGLALVILSFYLSA
ncbi:MAG TPA: hypothetical protein VK483_04610 [Chitinophagaceae bacterium]|nr:hypothetical protein [Chitinophagaceae bacterium]